MRILAGVAIGAMLITATAFIYQEVRQGEVGSSPSSEVMAEFQFPT